MTFALLIAQLWTSIETRIRLLFIVSLIFALFQTVFNVLYFFLYKKTMGNFQTSWLYFQTAALITLLLVLLYGFHAMARQTHRCATSFRSWLLFISTSLFFSGFFHIIGQIKDADLFYNSCSRGFEAPTHGLRLPDGIAVHPTSYCRKAFHTLLVSYAIIWSSHQLILVSLFLSVNRFKNDNFADEDEEEEEEEARQREVEKRASRVAVSAPRILIHQPQEDSVEETTTAGSW